MTVQTFAWRPLAGAQGNVSLRTRSAQFGDGYSQDVPDGLNNKVQSWPLQFSGRKATIQAIQDFLDDHAGARAFYWTPPLGKQALFLVKQYSPMAGRGGIYTISATFEQAFRP